MSERLNYYFKEEMSWHNWVEHKSHGQIHSVCWSFLSLMATYVKRTTYENDRAHCKEFTLALTDRGWNQIS